MTDPIVPNLPNTHFNGKKTSSTWLIMSAQVKCALLTLDNGLNELCAQTETHNNQNKEATAANGT